jgi:hypothetical protein
MCETAETAYKRCARDGPILKPDEMMFAIGANINKYAEENEYDDCGNFKRRQPILCLTGHA